MGWESVMLGLQQPPPPGEAAQHAPASIELAITLLPPSPALPHPPASSVICSAPMFIIGGWPWPSCHPPWAPCHPA